MTDYYLRSSSTTERLNSTAYTLGQRVSLLRSDAQANFAVMRRYVYECTVAGTSHTSPPIYPTVDGTTVTETAPSTLQWTCRECTSWANANKYADYISTRLAAGDRLLVSQAHAETSAVVSVITFTNSVPANPCFFLCVDDTTGLPATGATFTTTGANSLSLLGSITGYGLIFNCSTGAVGATLVVNSSTHVQLWRSCDFIHNTTTSGQTIRIGYNGSATVSALVTMENCRFKILNTGTRILVACQTRISGASFISGSVTPTTIFVGQANCPMDLIVDSSDFSDLTTTTVNLFTGGSYNAIAGLAQFRNIKMRSGWSGSIIGTNITTLGLRVEAYNVDSGDTNYTIKAADYAGSLVQETSIVRTGGASDGVTPLAWKLTTTANCLFHGARFMSPEIHKRVTALGSPVTVTVEILHDSTTNLKDDEMWLDVKYLGDSGFTTGLTERDVKTDFMAAGVDQATSGATWTTTGLTNPNTQKLEVTLTPQEAGYIIARVYMGKAGPYSIYVDPKLAVA